MLKRIRIICIAVIVISGIVSIYAMYDFANAIKEYRLSYWYNIADFVAEPLFFLAIGILAGSLIKAKIMDGVLIRRILVVIGLALMIIYCILVAIWLSGRAEGIVLYMLMYIVSHQWIFLLPGVFFGIGMCKL